MPATDARLPWRRRVPLALEVLCTYVPAWRAVRSNDLNGMVLQARRRQGPADGRPTQELHDEALTLGRATMRVLTLLPSDDRCLVRSLVTLDLMARRGIEGRLVIGVQAAPSFMAHAWVEHDGRPVTPEGQYDRLVEV